MHSLQVDTDSIDPVPPEYLHEAIFHFAKGVTCIDALPKGIQKHDIQN